MLAIGDGKQGWSMTTVDRDSAMARTLEMAKRSVVSEGEEKSIADFMAARSRPYSDGRNLKPMPDRPTLGRFLRLCRIGCPSWIVPKFLGLASLIVVQTLVEDVTFQIQGHMLGVRHPLLYVCGRARVRVAVRRSSQLPRSSLAADCMHACLDAIQALMAMDKFEMLRLARNATLAAFAQGVIWESMLFIQREAGADMAQKIENNLFDRLCANNNFYIMSQLDARIKDGEHRITDDVLYLHLTTCMADKSCTHEFCFSSDQLSPGNGSLPILLVSPFSAQLYGHRHFPILSGVGTRTVPLGTFRRHHWGLAPSIQVNLVHLPHRQNLGLPMAGWNLGLYVVLGVLSQASDAGLPVLEP